MSNNPMTGDILIREVAKRTGYHIQDVKTFYYALIDVFADAISSQTPINARGFLSVSYTVVPPRMGNVQSDLIAKKENPDMEIRKTELPETVRIRVKFARNLRSGLREEERKEKDEVDLDQEE